MKTDLERQRLTSRAALAPMIALLLSVLAACGGSSTSSSASNNGGGSNGGGSPLPPGTELLYVGDNLGQIHPFSIDPNSGKLTAVASVVQITTPQPAGDVGISADPSGKALYATSNGLGGANVIALTIDPSTGALTPVAGAQSMSIPPGSIAVDPAGKNAYVTPTQGAQAAFLMGYSIAPGTHVLSPLPNQPTSLPGAASSLTLDPSGMFVYVTLNGNSGHEIAGFQRDPNTGLLSPLPGSPFADSGGDTPVGIRITPNGAFAIVANSNSSNVSVLAAAGNGALTDVSGSPFLTGANPDSVAIDANSKVVFVNNVGTNSLASYTIDSAGTLTSAGSPVLLGTNAQPGPIAVDPSNKFVYVSIVPREVAGFALDPSTGALTPIAGSPFTVGEVTRGIVVVKP